MLVRLLNPGPLLIGIAVLSLLLLSSCANPSPTVNAETDGRFAELEDYVGAALDRTNVPGAALAIVSSDGIEQQQTWGADGDGRPVTARTPFLWGSVAKPVCAQVVLAMVERDLLELDAPVQHYLPGFELADADHAARVTLRQLLNHTSGLPGDLLGLTDVVDPDRRPADILPALAAIEPDHEPGAVFQYASIDYAVIAAVIEEVTGQPYAVVAQSLLLDPMGARSVITTTEEAASELPRGHRYLYGTPVPFRTGYDPAGVGYAYLGGTLDDLARFAQLNLAGGTLSGRAVLEPGAVREAWAPDVWMSDNRDESYGLGWRSKQLPDGTPIVWHSGAVAGFFTHVILLPEQDRAVVLLQNAHGELQALDEYQAGFGAATLLAGGDPEALTTGRTYPLIVGAATMILLLIIAAVALTAVRLVRRTPVRRRLRGLRAAAWVVLAGSSWTVVLAMPQLVGLPLQQFWLWNPDLAALAYGMLGAITLLVALQLVRLVRVDLRVSGTVSR